MKISGKQIMTRPCITILFTLVLYATSCTQSNKVSCNCPKTMYADTKADTIFYLANGKSIALCGYRYEERKPIAFGEFILNVCGQDTFIDFWGALLTCRLKVNNDTLLI